MRKAENCGGSEAVAEGGLLAGVHGLAGVEGEVQRPAAVAQAEAEDEAFGGPVEEVAGAQSG
ncbi:MAG: hypothetical protein RQ748_11665 [Elusimicrobiales bacterium]|nr:hypothetical protein [Elusimicrobiales bacterium]